MKERPILFSAPMVRAVLYGTKTQTRRALRVQPPGATRGFCTYHHPDDDRKGAHHWALDGGSLLDFCLPCPYGQPGDRLWVRESWAEVPRHEPWTDEDLPWRKDGRILVYAADPQWSGARQFLCADGVLRWAKPERWRPSIHMPRWASRITLEVTGARVERLQDISEADAVAEGIVRQPDGGHGLADTTHYHFSDPRQSYFSLWEQINGPGSWAANPWVWAIEFRRIAP